MTGITQPSTEWCQRWTAGRASWRHRSEGGFDRSRYEAALLPEAEAKLAIGPRRSGSWPMSGCEELTGIDGAASLTNETRRP